MSHERLARIGQLKVRARIGRLLSLANRAFLRTPWVRLERLEPRLLMSAGASPDDSGPVIHTPLVTGAVTVENQPTTSGLVLTPNPLDANLSGFFRITDVENGTLFRHDGTTRIVNGTFITFAQGLAGLVFQPAPNSDATGTFMVQAATVNALFALGGSLVGASVVVRSPPTVSVGGDALNYVEQQGPTSLDPFIQISDPGGSTISGASIRLTRYVAGQEVLSFANRSGIAGAWDSQAGVLTLSGVASVADYQAALRSVAYSNFSSDTGVAERTAEIVVNDGSAVSAAAEFGIHIIGVNTRPIIALPSTQVTSQGVALTFSAAGGNEIAVGDADAGAGLEQLTIVATHGALDLADASGVVVVRGNHGATLIIEGKIARLNDAMNGLSFSPDNGYAGAARLSFTLDDLGNSGSGGSKTVSASLAIKVEPLAPPGVGGSNPSGTGSDSGGSNTGGAGQTGNPGKTVPTLGARPSLPPIEFPAILTRSSGSGVLASSFAVGAIPPENLPLPESSADQDQKNQQNAQRSALFMTPRFGSVAPNASPFMARLDSRADQASESLFSSIPVLLAESGESPKAESGDARIALARPVATYASNTKAFERFGSRFQIELPQQVASISPGGRMWRELDAVHKRITSDVSLRVWAGTASAMSIGASVAYFLWLTRAGSLLSSVMSSMPAWKLVDPLPILEHLGNTAAVLKRSEDDGLEKIIDEAGGNPMREANTP